MTVCVGWVGGGVAVCSEGGGGEGGGEGGREGREPSYFVYWLLTSNAV